MPITQILMTSATTDPDPIASTLPSTYNFNGSDNAWQTITGAYPFAGSSSVLTQNLGAIDRVSINLWFKPKQTSVAMLAELGQAQENYGYHYTMLEINSGGALTGRIWEGFGYTRVTTFTSVNLNAWNHVYLSFSGGTNGTISISLNGDTLSSTTLTRDPPTNTYIGLGSYDSTYITTTNQYRGRFNDLSISTSAGATSNFSSTRSYYGV